jgi:RNA polymerase sigma-70 factor, ECF subfamily
MSAYAYPSLPLDDRNSPAPASAGLSSTRSRDAASPSDIENSRPERTEEAEQIERARADIRDFAPLYETNVNRIYRYIYRRVGDHETAEDLTAQTFQQAIAALPGYQWRGVPFSAWLFRIAGNLIIRHHRVNGREIASEYIERLVDERGAFEDPLDAVLQQARRDLLYEALRRLSGDQQQALILKYAHGLKNHEVGKRMNRTEGGVKQLVHRAMIALRQTLPELEGNPAQAGD